MHWLTWLWCWVRRHERISGICLLCEGLRPISGGQFEASDIGDVVTGMTGAGQSIPAGVSDFAPDFTAPEPSAFSRFASSLREGASKFGSGLGKELTDSPLKGLTAALGLGATGLGIANQFGVQKQIGRQTQMIERGQKQAEAAAAPAVEFGKTTLDAASKGNLTPALQAQIDQWVQQAKADAAQRFASMGLGNSTQLDSFNRLIDQQAMSMKGQMLAQQEEVGLSGLQTGVSAGTSVMGVSQQQQTQLTQLIQGANQALGQITGRAA